MNDDGVSLACWRAKTRMQFFFIGCFDIREDNCSIFITGMWLVNSVFPNDSIDTNKFLYVLLLIYFNSFNTREYV